MYYFCTYFDHHYLIRGLALYYSLKRQCNNFSIYILCLTNECYAILNRLQLPNLILITLEELESSDKDLLETKQSRSTIEYYFTCTPSFIAFIFNKFAEPNFISYIDADLYFFSDPTPVFHEIGEHSIVITPHRFPSSLQHFEKYGKYNVGWLSFRRDKKGLSCLEWYRAKCIEWCFDYPENGRFADQKYLDYFPSLFDGVIELKQKGVNLAPWNISNYNITLDSKDIKIDGEPLIFYHFHGLKRLYSFIFDSGLSRYKASLSRNTKNNIYMPYLHELLMLQKEIGRSFGNGLRKQDAQWIQIIYKLFPEGVNSLRKFCQLLIILYTRTYIFYSKR